LRKFDNDTPILFYSGAAYERDKQAALVAGAQGYLTKPADNEKLVEEVFASYYGRSPIKYSYEFSACCCKWTFSYVDRCLVCHPLIFDCSV
jgi:FOG: CheY-like receiver